MFYQQEGGTRLELDCSAKPESYEAISTIIKIAKPVMSDGKRDADTHLL